uniref:Single domain-containing protein n=1 Tax=Timema bartmani TaxID=61472 RepID=A0A7R9F6A4_9NEOP|nr:unnamed protein product [Timema bartmani]
MDHRNIFYEPRRDSDKQKKWCYLGVQEKYVGGQSQGEDVGDARKGVQDGRVFSGCDSLWCLGSQCHDDSVINMGGTCGFTLASMCLCVTLAVVLTVTISGKVHAQNEIVDKEAILKPCFIPEKNLTMAVGTTIPDEGHHCRMKKCVGSKSSDSTNKMHFTIVTCPDVFYNGRNPTCKITEGNSDLPYPECCRRIDCSLEMQDEEDDEDYDDPTTTTTPKPTTRRPRRRYKKKKNKKFTKKRNKNFGQKTKKNTA